MPKHIQADGGLRGGGGAAPLAPGASIPITAPISEFKRLSGISRSRIYELLSSGELASVYIGARRFIIIQSYLDFIGRQGTGVRKWPRPRLRRRSAPRIARARGGVVDARCITAA